MRTSNLKYTILRVATLYGLGLFNKWKQSVNSMVLSAFSSGHFFVYGGACWRPFMKAKDAGKIIANFTNIEPQNEIINVSAENYQFQTVQQLIREVFQADSTEIHKTELRTYKVVNNKLLSLMPIIHTDHIGSSIEEMKAFLNDAISETHFKDLLTLY